MIDYNRKKHDNNSISSDDSSTMKTVWNRLSHLFRTSEDSNRRLSTSSNESNSSKGSSCSIERRSHNRRKKVLVDSYSGSANESRASALVIPPFSPTYCKANEFPYSNFYVKLPNGKWMVRYRSGNRDILGTDEFEGYM
ncbi:hypothetical protein BD408DRAFT_426139, partial [Parasitella parasitica]